ncbi:MAG TPA: NnrU family protein [Burkholderiales bacterium]|nr:NnrU family protein [Burkholderiales bacterium]
MGSLFLATLGFVAGHFLLSAPPLRSRLAALLGEKAFLGVYSLLMAAFLAWAVMAYRAAPAVVLWDLGPLGRRLPLVVMPAALLLAVAGFTTRSATAVGGEAVLAAGRGVSGIFTITRHPFLWGAGLWSLAHLAANGDQASLILFGGVAALSFGGMLAIDHKRAVSGGEAWRDYSVRTSVLPFAAAIAGRVRVDWAGIGWLRLGAAVAIYLALVAGHGRLFGVAALVW